MGDWHDSMEATRRVGGDGRESGGGIGRFSSQQAAMPPTAALAYPLQHPPLGTSPGARTGYVARPVPPWTDEVHGGFPPPSPALTVDWVYPPPPVSTSSCSSASSWARHAAENRDKRLGRAQRAAAEPAPVADRHRGRSRSRVRHAGGMRLANSSARPDGTPLRASPVRHHHAHQSLGSPVSGGESGGGGCGGTASRHRGRLSPRTGSPSRGRRQSNAAATRDPRHGRSRSHVNARHLNQGVHSPQPRRPRTPRVGSANDGRPVEHHCESQEDTPRGGRRHAADNDVDDRRWWPPAAADGDASHARSRGRPVGRNDTPGHPGTYVAAPAGVQWGGYGHGSGGGRGRGSGSGRSHSSQADENGGHFVRGMGGGVAVKDAADNSRALSCRNGDMRRIRSIGDLALVSSQRTPRVGPAAYVDEGYRAAAVRAYGGGGPYQRAVQPPSRSVAWQTWRTEEPTVRQSAGAYPYAPSRQSHVCRAILIGATYRNDRDQSKWLPGPDRDVVSVRRMLWDIWGVPDAQVTILTDGPEVSRAGLFVAGEPKREAIFRACRAVVSSSVAGDTIFFFFSGHGSRARDTAGDEVDGWDNTIVPTDWATPEGSAPITDDRLYQMLVKDLASGVRLFAAFDCCHSCNVLGLPNQFLAADGPNDLPTPRVAVPPEALMEKGWRAPGLRGLIGVAGGGADADDRTRGATSVPELIIRSVRAAMDAVSVSAITHPPTLGIAWCLAACGATATSTNSRCSGGAQGALTHAFVQSVRRAAERAGGGGPSGGWRRGAILPLTYWALRRDIWAELRKQGISQVPVLSASASDARMGQRLQL